MNQFIRLIGLARARETGYGSVACAAACDAQAELSWIKGAGPRAAGHRLWKSVLPQLCYRLSLPTQRVELTQSAEATMIREHLAIRRHGIRPYRRAQGVLPLPGDFSDYIRGRHRQAVRTNVTRAREAGLRVEMVLDEAWTPGSVDSRAHHLSPGPVELWRVFDSDGTVLANSILSVDDRIALLHGLVSHAPYARWLVHTAIVERLCGHCELLICNSDAVYQMSAGARHFQRLLGYQVATLEVPRERGITGRRRRPVSRRAATRRRQASWDAESVR